MSESVETKPLDEKAALLAAIAANPLEDTPRLAFADWLDEQPVIHLKCQTCKGKGRMGATWKLVPAPVRAGYVEDATGGDVCKSCGGKKFIIAASSRDNMNRAQFIRVGCGIATHDANGPTLDESWRDGPVCVKCRSQMGIRDFRRGSSLPGCPDCLGTGDLGGLHRRFTYAYGQEPIMRIEKVHLRWLRGFPDKVMVPNASDLWHFLNYESFEVKPDPWLISVLRTHPVRGAYPFNKRPERLDPKTFGWVKSSGGSGYDDSRIPDQIFSCLTGKPLMAGLILDSVWRIYPQHELATADLATAICTWARAHPHFKGYVTDDELKTKLSGSP